MHLSAQSVPVKINRYRNKIIDNDRMGKNIYNGNKAGARTCEYMGAMEAFKHLSSDIFS